MKLKLHSQNSNIPETHPDIIDWNWSQIFILKQMHLVGSYI